MKKFCFPSAIHTTHSPTHFQLHLPKTHIRTITTDTTTFLTIEKKRQILQSANVKLQYLRDPLHTCKTHLQKLIHFNKPTSAYALYKVRFSSPEHLQTLSVVETSALFKSLMTDPVAYEQQIREFFGDLKASESEKLKPTSEMYECMVFCCLKWNDLGLGLRLFDEMEKLGLVGNIAVWNYLLELFLVVGKTLKGAAFHEVALASGSGKDLRIGNVPSAGISQFQRGYQIFVRLLKGGIGIPAANVESYLLGLKLASEVGSKQMIDQAFEMGLGRMQELHKMKLEDGIAKGNRSGVGALLVVNYMLSLYKSGYADDAERVFVDYYLPDRVPFPRNHPDVVVNTHRIGLQYFAHSKSLHSRVLRTLISICERRNDEKKALFYWNRFVSPPTEQRSATLEEFIPDFTTCLKFMQFFDNAEPSEETDSNDFSSLTEFQFSSKFAKPFFHYIVERLDIKEGSKSWVHLVVAQISIHLKLKDFEKCDEFYEMLVAKSDDVLLPKVFVLMEQVGIEKKKIQS
ncbi:hypothetical protein HK098_007314 [Nowakowskiella sp. JEL0407]|nr:hypothetical protein HK098_007314 [Nowakowskiella sp. JEL0407]